MKKVIILGLTGSIGQTALNGCRENDKELKIIGASCYSNAEKAVKLCYENNIPNLCILDPLKKQFYADNLKIFHSIKEVLFELQADVVLNGIGGSAGLQASIDTVDSKNTLALANKETVVLGGNVFLDYAKRNKVRIIPVDSEHSAIEELIMTNGMENISKLIITASGGPFLNYSHNELEKITPQQAIKHPTWKMGPKISIDSSTLANKGLEVIEAHYLFGFEGNRIEVVIHPQSIVHSMVRTKSGQIYAQMSPPDMKFPIMRALLDRKYSKPVGDALDFTNLSLNFKNWNPQQFPMLKYAFDCVEKGGIFPLIYNTANESAVENFMKGKISYNQISDFVSNALELNWNYNIGNINDFLPVLQEVKQRLEK